MPMDQWTPPEAGEGAPDEVRAILRKVYSSYRDEHPAENAETKATGAKIAWSAVKRAGWYKDAEGRWKKRKAMTDNSGGSPMALTAEQRAALITHLTTNCDCWKGDGDADVLNTFDDDRLSRLKAGVDRTAAAVAVANAAVAGVKDGDGNVFRVNPESGKWEKGKVEPEPKAKPAPKAVANADDEPDEPPAPKPAAAKVDRPRTREEWLKAAPEEVLNEIRTANAIVNTKKDEVINGLVARLPEHDRVAYREILQNKSLADVELMAAFVPKGQPADEPDDAPSGKRPRRQASQPQDEDMLGIQTINWGPADEGPVRAAQHQADVLDNADMSDEDAMKALPASTQARLRAALLLEEEEKARVINELTKGITDEQAEGRLVARLQRKSLDELKDLRALKGEPSGDRQGAVRPNYFGSSAAIPSSVTANAGANDDLLPLPSMTFEDFTKKRKA